MKKTIIKACAIAAALVAAQGMYAQSITPITSVGSMANGDLLLGVRTTVAGKYDLMIDLGQFSSLTSGASLSISSDLAAIGTASSLYYGVFAVTDGGTVYATTPTVSHLFSGLGTSQANFTQGNYLQPLDPGAVGYQTLGYDLSGFSDSQSTAHGGYIIASDVNSWSSQNPGSAAFGQSTYQIESAIGSNAYLDVAPKSGTGSPTQVGVFNLSSGGLLTYNAVPEPGTYALFGLGALLLVIAVRRKSHNA